MKKSFYLSLIVAFSFSTIFAQKSVNSYKYVLVPKQYEFLKSPDKHQLNSLTKFLFDKAGFTTLFTDEVYPLELATNSCLALKVVVDDNSGMFNTKLRINLLNCHNIVVYSTREGRSKEKEYKKAYHDALRKAFEEIKGLNYAYNGSLNNDQKEIVVQDGAIQIVQEEVKLTDEMIDIIIESKLKEKENKPVLEKETKKVQKSKIEPVEEKNTKKIAVKEVEPVVEKEAKKVALKQVESVAEVRTKKAKKLKKQAAVEEKKEIIKKQKVLKKSVPEVASINSLEGKYDMDKWGECAISKKDNIYAVVGGDENFEFAKIFKTSKPAVYIIKWAAYKQPQLLEIDNNGNLKVDTENGVKIYLRTN
jgi:hypothetical protein